MKDSKFIICLIILLLYTVPTKAVIVPSLYEARLPMANFSEQTRQQLFSEALQQVLIKISGNIAITTLPEIRSKLESADSLVSSYDYIKNDNKMLLDVRFNSKGIQQILRDTKQALWGNDRPLILVWLDINDGNTDTILSSNSDSFLVSILKNNAYRLGLPIMLPMMDSYDLNRVSGNDVKQVNLSVIRTASQRYGVNTILLGYIFKSLQNTWQSKWTLLTIDNAQSWNIAENDDIEQIFTKVTNNVASSLAARFAILNDNALQSQLTVLVSGITDLSECAALMKYLNNLNMVTDVEPIDINPNYVKFQVISIDGMQGLSDEIADGNKLVATQPVIQNAEADLFYRWTQV